MTTARTTFRMRDRETGFWAAATLLLAAAIGVIVASDANAAGDESGYIPLSGPNAREHWLGYGMDQADDSWPKTWEHEDGVLHATGGGADLKTREQYGDFDLRFEWKSAPGANSGVMYRVSQETDPAYFTGPEYQVWDKPADDTTTTAAQRTASLYDLYPASDPTPKSAGEWNEGRIVVRGNHVEHYLNGNKVVELELGSDDWNKRVAASKFGAWKKFGKNPRGHIVLQDHGDPISYRNIRIKSFDGAAPAN